MSWNHAHLSTRSRLLAGLSSIILALGVAIGLSASPSSASTPGRKVLVIGVDGATYSAFSRTSLPTIERLRANGVRPD